LEGHFTGKGVEEDESEEVAQKLRQREKCDQSQKIQEPGKVIAILDKGVVLALVLVAVPQLDAATLQFKEQYRTQ